MSRLAAPRLRVLAGRSLLVVLSTALTLGAAEWVLSKTPLGQAETAFLSWREQSPVAGAKGSDISDASPAVLEEGQYRRRTADTSRLLGTPEGVFRIPKPPDVFRVFAFGGSTTVGCPIKIAAGPGRDLSFPGWLGVRLQRRFPDREIEVLNVGHGGQNLERTVQYALECLDYEPDAFVIYSGHNEFLPHSVLAARSRASRTLSLAAGSPLLEMHLGRLWHQFLVSLEERAHPEIGTRDFATPESMIGECFHTPADEREILTGYRQLLLRVARRCAERDVELFLCTLISNVADFEPNLSFVRPAPPAEEAQAWERRIGKAREALAAGNAPQALELLDGLPEVAGDLAEVHFRRGKALAALGRREEAAEALGLARDRDGIPRRASRAQNEIVRSVCQDTAANLVDVERHLDALRGGAPAGNDLFYDNCHPNFAGNLAIVEALEEALIGAGCLGPAPDPAPPLARTLDLLADAASAPTGSALEELRALGFQPGLMAYLHADLARSYGTLVLARRYDAAERLRVARELIGRVPERLPYYEQYQQVLGCVEIIAGEDEAAARRFEQHGIDRESTVQFMEKMAARCRSVEVRRAFERAGYLGPH